MTRKIRLEQSFGQEVFVWQCQKNYSITLCRFKKLCFLENFVQLRSSLHSLRKICLFVQKNFVGEVYVVLGNFGSLSFLKKMDKSKTVCRKNMYRNAAKKFLLAVIVQLKQLLLIES